MITVSNKKPPKVFYKERCSWKFRKIQRKTPVPEVYSVHSVHWSINPNPLFLAKPPPLKSANYSRHPPFSAIPPLYWFFVNPL